MYVSQDKLASTNKAGIDAMISLAYTQFAAFERLAALNINTAKSNFEDAAEHLKAVLDAKDPQELVRLNTAFAQPSIEKAISYTKSVYDLAQQTTAQVSKLAESNAAELNKTMTGVLENLAKNAPAGSDVAVNAMKSALSAANTAYDSMSRVAQQAAEVVEGNFAAATDAANSATKSAKRKAA